MRFSILIFLYAGLISGASASPADTTKRDPVFNPNKHPVKQFYTATGAELIFALGDLQADSLQFDNHLRFSLFPHVQQQFHYNWSNWSGFYTGISLINVGFRHDVRTADGFDFELRHRSLSLGIPLALKLGNMQNGNYLALGANAEFMFHYKYKVYYADNKAKYKDWFSDKVNVFNPSVFVDLRNKTGGYIRFKYYLNPFLRNVSTTYLLPETSTTVSFAPSQSPLFYISVGSTFMKKKTRKLTLDDV